MAYRRSYRRKFKRRRFNRRYRRRTSRTYRIAKRAAKRVVRTMAERKFVRFSVSGSIPNSGYYYPLFDGIPQGTTINTRIGGEVRMLGWYFQGYIDFSGVPSITTVRCILVTAKNEGDPVSLSDFPAGASGTYIALNTNVMNVLRDFTMTYTPGVSSSRRRFTMRMRFPRGKRVRYDNNSSSVAQGQVFLYMMSDKITPDPMPFLYGFHSVKFTDA